MVTRTLQAGDFDAIHAAFVDAFSDYVVPLRPDRDRLAEMLTRRGWVPEASVGIFEGDRIVAFTLNGVRDDRGYDSGTGVVTSHRRRGLAREVMLRSMDVLRSRGCGSYVLEVIDSNPAAIALYRALGFEETRGLQCWSFEGGPGSPATETREAADDRRDWDIEPSWQNSRESIRDARDEAVVLEISGGQAVLFPTIGDLARMVVRRDCRRRGIGTRLLHAAAARAGKALKIVNVDERDRGVAAFLEHAGATRTVRQLEMRRPL